MVSQFVLNVRNKPIRAPRPHDPWVKRCAHLRDYHILSITKLASRY